MRARGGLIERQWRGTIEHAAYAPERDQLWTLQSPATLVAGPAPASGAQQKADLVRLDDFCLGSAGQRACVSASFRSAEDWTIDAKASAFALDRVGKLYREDLDLEGIVDATLEAVGGPAARCVVAPSFTRRKGASSCPATPRSPAGAAIATPACAWSPVPTERARTPRSS